MKKILDLDFKDKKYLKFKKKLEKEIEKQTLGYIPCKIITAKESCSIHNSFCGYSTTTTTDSYKMLIYLIKKYCVEKNIAVEFNHSRYIEIRFQHEHAVLSSITLKEGEGNKYESKKS